MPLTRIDTFLEEVLTYVKFPFDRKAIEFELECHIGDKMDYYIEQGYDKVEAEQRSIDDMGDAREIGIELNKQHNPFLGWLWKVTNVIVILFVVWDIYAIVTPFIDYIFIGNPINEISKSDIVYKIDVDEKVKLDDTTIHFTNLIYEQNGDMNIVYEYYDTNLFGREWTLNTIGDISDNLGNKYSGGSGSTYGGIKSKCIDTVDKFSTQADTLIISYDSYNRKYKVEIPLKVGDHNE